MEERKKKEREREREMDDRAGDGSRRYEPSAPPLPLTPYTPPPPPAPHYYSHIDDDEDAYPSVSPSAGGGYGGPPHTRLHSRYSEENETLGARLVDMLGNAFKGLLKTSHSVVSLDLRRAVLHDGPPRSRQRRRRPRNDSDENWSFDEEADWQPVRPQRKWMDRIQGGSARLKLLQVWDFRNSKTGEPKFPWGLNLGLGMNFQIDGGKLEPKLRIRGKHVSLHLLPRPLLELRGKWPLANTGLAVDARYRIPLDKVAVNRDFSGARLMVNLFNPLGTGFHLTPGGLEFDEHVVQIGKYTRLRVAAAVEFPRQFPVEKGENPLRIEVRRLGLKTTIV
ncbi:hypothetical protein O6H91_13G079100 [Diphasiastrum complanatum]|uniref:Uncharacterized protein n=1 Tax=Diphasiastrum complanatum TaxID=34168 RepID=A0ACC2BWE3_DIPCM|nr:hypothetical protein O6H91_13G079100 [Diphasiastrum complanatum]